MTQNLAVLLDLILSGLNCYKGICLFFYFKFFETIGLLFTKFSNNMTLSEIAMVKFFICFDWPSYCTCVIFIHVFFTFWYCNDTWLISVFRKCYVLLVNSSSAYLFRLMWPNVRTFQASLAFFIRTSNIIHNITSGALQMKWFSKAFFLLYSSLH